MDRFACLLAAYAAMTACTPCPRLECRPAVELIIGTTDETYVIELDLDGQSIRATCEPGAICEVETGSGPYWAWANRSDASLELEIFGAREDAPEMIEVDILAGESLVHEASLTPVYRDAPRDENDDSCGVCRSADEPFVLPGS